MKSWSRTTMVIILAMSISIMAQVPMLESLQESVYSRWDFQKRFPASTRLFSGSLDAVERAALIGDIRTAQPKGVANPAAPTFADLWASFTLGLALEKTQAGTGEPDLLLASQMAKGNIAVNFELARLLTQASLSERARPFQLETQRSMLEKGYVRVPELAKQELRLAREALNKKQYGKARHHAEFAFRLDPYCPWVPFFLMEMELREKSPLDWNLGSTWNQFLETVRLLRYYDSQALAVINLMVALRIGLGVFGAALILLLAARYFTRIAHIPAERLPQDVELRVRYLALGLIPVSVAIGGLGYAVVGLILVMLVWKHASGPEKSLLKVVLMAMALIPVGLACEKSLGRYLDDTVGVNLYHQAYERGYETRLIDGITAFHPKTVEDSMYQALAFSVAYKKQGNYVKAREYSRLAKAKAGSNPFPLLNAGSLSLLTFDFSGASKTYAQARVAAPDMVETWFNSSQAELYSNNSDQHKKYLDRAAEEDAQLLTQYLRDNDENFPQYPANRQTMDPMLRPGQSWSGVLNGLLNLDFLTVRMRMGIYEIFGSWLMAAVGLVSLLLYFRFRHYSQHSHGRDLFDCKICGKVMCRTCRKGVHCQSCFRAVSGIQDNRVKLEMAKRIEMRAKATLVRIVVVLNTLLPGAGLVFLGQGAGRFLWVLVSSLVLGLLWQSNHLLMEYPAFVVGPLHWLAWLPVAAWYGLFNLKMIRAPLDLATVSVASNNLDKEQAR